MREILDLWLQREPDEAALAAAHAEILGHRDVRFIAPLIELIRAGGARFAHLDPSQVELLGALAGVSYGRTWDRWADWYGRTSLTPPPGFTGWKGRVMAGFDPDFATLLSDGAPSTIRVEMIAWGGVPVDGIVTLDAPAIIAAAEATYLRPDEPVYGVLLNGEARAYPLRIMDAHEMANDVLGGVPVAITHCPLCGSGVAYDRRAPDGRTYTLRTSGLLFQSNKLMYDAETRSLWHQFTGRPVIGPLVQTSAGTDGAWLTVLPMVLTTWEAWLTAHPKTSVLSLETGFGEGYSPGLPYLQYYTTADLLFPVSNRQPLLPAKSWVYGIEADGAAKAWAGRLLRRDQVVNDRVGTTDVVLLSASDWVRVQAEASQFTEDSYVGGLQVRAYERPSSVNFVPGAPDEGTVTDHRGRTWQVTEDALVGPDGEVLPRIIGHLSFWVGWNAFHPDTELIGGR